MAEKIVAGGNTYESEVDALYALQNLLLARVEGKLSAEQDREYVGLRRALMRLDQYRSALPLLVRQHNDLGGVWSELRKFDQWEPRRQFVREQMRAAMDVAMSADGPPEYAEAEGHTGTPSSGWTGIQSGRERLRAAKSLIPFAMASVEGLLAELERPTGNGGPPLEDKQEAIDNLRALHQALGQILEAIDDGRLADPRGNNIATEAARYAARAARALRNDPMPYLVSGGIAALLGLLGFGALGAYLSGVATTFRKNAGS
jgi:hypothetical protein